MLSSFKIKSIFDKRDGGHRSTVDFLVVHNTKNSDPTAGACNNAKYCRNETRGAGAHYFIDDTCIVQGVNESNVAYSVGDQFKKGVKISYFRLNPQDRQEKLPSDLYRYPKQSCSPYRALVWNTNSISFEMCLGGGRDSTIIYRKTAAAIAYNLIKYKLTLGCVVTHDMASGKNCTGWNDKQFSEFMELVSYYHKGMINSAAIKLSDKQNH
jgi:N-acetylmuramoyl-L-alanine amidase CwlA